MNPMNRFDDEPTAPPATRPALPRATTTLTASDLAFSDIDFLFHAVRARIALTASDAFSAHCVANAEDPAARIRTTVLECVTELEQLQATMAYEVGRRRLLEQTVSNLQDVLAAVRVELAGTQAGEREARHRASHDHLTLLPNAEVFRHRLDDALARSDTPARPLAVLFLDLDGFKAINEAHGHEIGDAVLRIVAVRLVGGMPAGEFVSRVGGDEFACLFAGASSRDQLSHVVRKLFDLVTSPLKIGPLTLSVRPSIGVVVCPADGTSADTLLRRADAAMYRAKRTHTGFAFFDARLDEGDAARLSPRQFDRLTFTGLPGDGQDHYRPAATEISAANPPPRTDTQHQTTP